ncbi:chromate efflux transporter [Shewanella waksmanii]|uniref:chromate efflux transporter n=1 Tax=Shewanella waksmanii TaxID=213783 RepID=UPI000491E344|nr:chromate efflux transporter [Shewanella waksmanii]
MLNIFIQFLLLGLVSFGGPAAHIGYFRKTFVDKLQWVKPEEYGSYVALSQFLPGPGSSQVGFAIGYHRGGIGGAIAAFVGFTLPSFLLLYFIAVTSQAWLEQSLFVGLIHGLKLLAVIVVADAILTMYRQFCLSWQSKIILLASTVVSLSFTGSITQIVLLLVAALVGATVLQQAPSAEPVAKGRLNIMALASFVLLVLGSLLLLTGSGLGRIFADFYQAGTLVFGGGHVVLPLLESSVSEAMSAERFLTGYALAQAVPGPMFTLAAFLGAELNPSSPFLGALVATLAIFLPGLLLLLGILNRWRSLSQQPRINGALIAINACVVGFLVAAFYSPVATSALLNWLDVVLVIGGFIWLQKFKPNILLLVLAAASVGMLLSYVG